MSNIKRMLLGLFLVLSLGAAIWNALSGSYGPATFYILVAILVTLLDERVS